MRNKKTSGNLSGKGYYIALVLCAVAIGISGFLYYRNVNEKEPQLNTPTLDVGAVEQEATKDVAAVATEPGKEATKTPEPLPAKPKKTVSPVEGKTVSVYAMDCLSYNQTTRDWRTHDGVDIAAKAGAQVSAAADGTVYTVYEDDTMGTTVVIRHDDGYVTRYASLDEKVAVSAGDSVTAGQKIGAVGNTALLESAIGDHIHFSVTCNDTPVNPAEFLNQE